MWPDYIEFLASCDVERAEVEARVRAAVPDGVLVTGRTKSTDTLREKLIRIPEIQLPSIDDVIGVRVVGDLLLTEQDELAERLSRELGGTVKIKDRREIPSVGYRGLHLITKDDGFRVEIQIRTRLQAEWADTFEGLADRWGRQIRYGQDVNPDSAGIRDARRQMIAELVDLSVDSIAHFERSLADIASDRYIAKSKAKPISRRSSKRDIARAMRIRENEKRMAVLQTDIDQSIEEWRALLLSGLDELANRMLTTP